MKKKWFYFLFFAFSFTNNAFGQTVPVKEINLVQSLPAKGWYRFNPESSLPGNIFLKQFGSFFGINPGNEMSLLRVDADNLGMKHYRFQQLYNNVPVEGAQFLLHEKNNKVVSGNGTIIKDLALAVNPALSDQSAISAAKNYINAEVYLWEDPEAEHSIKNATNNSASSFLPQPELVIVDPDFSDNPSNYRLAWKIKMYSLIPLKGEMVYVDAASGNVIKSINLIHDIQVAGIAETKYSGTQTIMVDSIASNQYVLREQSRGIGMGVETYNLKNKLSYSTAVDFADTNNYWNNVNPQKDEAATDAHWGAEMTYDYYIQKHGRNSFDNNGSKLISYIHYGNNYVNAFWNGLWMTYGDGNSTYKILTALDICGHEITHGVTQKTAGLIYQNEQGALNESFSDIFGAHIEFFTKPSTANWTMAEELGLPFRNMANPKQFSNPDTYNGQFYYTGSADYGGVHSNSGVQNKWFYLLSDGGTGTNDVGSIYNVTGIGIEKAAQIAYRNLAYYLISTSKFFDARQGSISAAEDIYGFCSTEAYETAKAWYAVGVGDPINNKDIAALKIITVASKCGLTSNEPVQLLFRYDGCSSVPAGDTVFLSYSLNSIITVTDTLALATTLNPGDSVLHTFSKNADLSIVKEHRFRGWMHYKGDTLNYNDSLAEVVVENKLAQNFDIKLSKLIAPVSNCSLGPNELVKLLGFFNGCDSLVSGTKLPFAYKLNGGTANIDTLTLNKTLFPNDSIAFSFNANANLSAKEIYKFDIWSAYTIDTINTNDTLKNIVVANPILPDSSYIRFEDTLNVVDSFYVAKGSMANIYFATAAKKTGKYGLQMTGGDWFNNRRKYRGANDLNSWTVNPEFSAKACFCVDATTWTKLYMNFDLKQVFQTAYSSLSGYLYPYTSNMRILVNDVQVGQTFNPVTQKTDAYLTKVIDLSAYAGQYSTICIETKNYQNPKNDNAFGFGDCAYIDNIQFSQVNTALGINVNEAENSFFEVFPNPGNGLFNIHYQTHSAGKIKIQLMNLLGEIILKKEENSFTGKNTYLLNETLLPVGIYYVTMFDGIERLTKKLVVVK